MAGVRSSLSGPASLPTCRTAISAAAGRRRASHATRRAPGTVATPQAGPSTPPPISLVIIDDNRLLLEGLVTLIDAQPGFRILMASTKVDEVIAMLKEVTADIVLLDIGLEDHDSLTVTAMVRQECPSARVIVMGLLSGQDEVADHVRVGASGFIMKEASAEDLFSTIRSVAGGAEVLPPTLTNTLFTQISQVPKPGSDTRRLEAVGLTARELEVVDLLGTGLSNKEIATRLNIAVHTVKSHVHNTLEKLALNSRLEVAAFVHGRRAAPDLPHRDP